MSKSLLQCSVLSLYLTISLEIVGATKDSMRSKGVPKFSSELCSEMWVPIMDHIVRQAKLSDSTLKKQLCNLFSAQQTCPKSTCSQNSVLCQTINQVKMAL